MQKHFGTCTAQDTTFGTCNSRTQGNKIPKWVQHQSIGFSSTISLPPNWYKNLLDFTFCAVFEYGKIIHAEGRRMRMECKFKSSCAKAITCLQVSAIGIGM